jgi:hypothetical protein
MDVLIVKKRYGMFEGFEGAKLANKCLPYDSVSFNTTGCTLVKRHTHPILVGILETTGPKYGLTSHKHPIYLCKPLDTSYPPFYIGSKIIDPVYNKLITFQIENWDKEFPKGNFIDLLGNCGDYQVEKKACLLLASPYKWKKILPEIIEPHKNSRLYIDGYTFNIDPDGCRDVDDCISFMDNKLIISISDVSAWVETNPWMKFAEYIGISFNNIINSFKFSCTVFNRFSRTFSLSNSIYFFHFLVIISERIPLCILENPQCLGIFINFSYSLK